MGLVHFEVHPVISSCANVFYQLFPRRVGDINPAANVPSAVSASLFTLLYGITKKAHKAKKKKITLRAEGRFSTARQRQRRISNGSWESNRCSCVSASSRVQRDARESRSSLKQMYAAASRVALLENGASNLCLNYWKHAEREPERWRQTQRKKEKGPLAGHSLLQHNREAIMCRLIVECFFVCPLQCGLFL